MAAVIIDSIMPDIFTHRHSDGQSPTAEQLTGRTRFKIAVLIEDIIFGQQLFSGFVDNITLMGHQYRVVERFTTALRASLKTAEHHLDRRQLINQLVYGRLVVIYKGTSFEQIERRIAGYGQFRENGKFTAQVCGFVGIADDFVTIVVKIPDNRI